ncbi:hypothetical protein LF65_03636 [Clostridium beijerinckii]|uniref:HTH tetR-type domain-containing protein n=1 Tax=Clostridium beijerinckii TaxID=1520 RepID=A0A0B5QQF2_CLOBE|nr:TetR/AcrR family transcriptional regulator [Clostridium beijerinckii]AJH00193.1 hypothetical protein LF65_03636 [Clostridium beijerinckii]
MGNKNDARYKRTHKLIMDTFKNMIIEMDFTKITIKDLTNIAGINRKTFYLHYYSLDEILYELQNEIINGLIDILNQETSDENSIDIQKFMTAFSKLLSDDQPLHQRLLCCENYRFVAEQVQNIVTEKCSEKFFAGKHIDTSHKNMVTAYLSHSILTLWRNWLLSGCEMTKDEMIYFSTQLVEHGLDSIN